MLGRLVTAGLVTRGRIAARLGEASGIDHERLARLNSDVRELSAALEARVIDENTDLRSLCSPELEP